MLFAANRLSSTDFIFSIRMSRVGSGGGGNEVDFSIFTSGGNLTSGSASLRINISINLALDRTYGNSLLGTIVLRSPIP